MPLAPPASAANELFGDPAVRQLLQSIEALVLVLSRTGDIYDCNGTCERVSGFPGEQLVGRNIAGALAHGKEPEVLLGQITDLAQGTRNGRFESFILTKDGDTRRIRWSGVCIDTPAQPGGMLLLTGIDITRQYDAEKRLAESAEITAQLHKKLVQIEEKYNHGANVPIERRAERRILFPRRQRIAPFVHRNLPTEDEFFRVECRDIGARGLGFYLDAKPAADQYIVELGSRDNAIYLTAAVKHSTLALSEGGERYLIGCHYTGRLTS